MAPAQNFTIPSGWTDHGVKGLVCRPTDWTTMASFFISNYIAHAFTIKKTPGQSTANYVAAMFIAFCYPSFGVSRALETLIYCTVLPFCDKPDGLQQALEDDALCMLVRSRTWKPRQGDILRQLVDNARYDLGIPVQARETGASKYKIYSPDYSNRAAKGSGSFDSIKVSLAPVGRGRSIHGIHELPPGGEYEFLIVPVNAEVHPLHTQAGDLGGPCKPMAASKTALPVLIALYQICYGSVSLYRARGDQVDLYGYATFGLTVIPYVLMAVINLLVQLLSNDYPDLYMIHTLEMDEAIKRGGRFEGVVGTVHPPETQDPDDNDVLEEREDIPVQWWKVMSTSVADNRELFTLERSGGRYDIGPETITITQETGNGNVRQLSAPDLTIPCFSDFPRRRHRRKGPLFCNDAYESFNGEPSARLVGFLGQVYGSILINGISIAINAAVSRFRNGTDSIRLQRGFILTWIVWNCIYGQLGDLILRLWTVYSHAYSRSSSILDKTFVLSRALLFHAVWFLPAIGGMVIAGLEMGDYGSCIRIAT